MIDKPISVYIHCRNSPNRAFATIFSVKKSFANAQIILVKAPGVILEDDIKKEADLVVEANFLSEAYNSTRNNASEIVLFCDDCFSIPKIDEDILDLFDDQRVASVSLVSNVSANHNFPYSQPGMHHLPAQHSPESINQMLKSALNRKSALILVPDSGCVLFNSTLLNRFNGFNTSFGDRFELTLTDYGLKTHIHGYRHLICASSSAFLEAENKTREENWTINQNDLNHFKNNYRYGDSLSSPEYFSTNSLAYRLLDFARNLLVGIKVRVDALSLGEREMGTQVQVVNLIKNLCENPTISKIHVLLSGELPHYASELLTYPKIVFEVVKSEEDYEDLEMVDIFHRPYQPDEYFDIDLVKQSSRQTVITIQDTIAYQNSAYFNSISGWEYYRENFRKSLIEADGIIVISNDVLNAISDCGIALTAQTKVVLNGIDHLQYSSKEQHVPALLAKSFDANFTFIFVLGTDHSHKNRDFAIEVWQKLKQTNYHPKLIFAGSAVPNGSSRIREMQALNAFETKDGDEPIYLADVSSSERNWLLANAICVLYPTSAEGFGLVPYEAATFETPAVFVPFGPFAELGDWTNLLPSTWSVDEFAKTIMKFIEQPETKSNFVSQLKSLLDLYSWEDTGANVAEFYWSVCAKLACSD